MADDDKKKQEKPVVEIQEMKPKHPISPELQAARDAHDAASKGYPARLVVDLDKTPAEREKDRKEEPKEPKKEDVKPVDPNKLRKPPEKFDAKKEPEGRGSK